MSKLKHELPEALAAAAKARLEDWQSNSSFPGPHVLDSTDPARLHALVSPSSGIIAAYA